MELHLRLRRLFLTVPWARWE
jgi:uncharacterized damage-inducible protein DinB